MAGPIRISFLADVGRAQQNIRSVASETEAAGNAVESSGAEMAGGFSAAGDAAVKLNAAVDVASGALAGIDAIQNGARAEAERLARAQLNVEQAMADGEQAAVDLRQATLDLSQAQLDGRQAAVDVTQAQIDSKQADLDATVAQKEYNAAVKEFGKGSVEARQLAIDLAQAKADQKQASVDLAQAQEDGKQAQLDATQAQVDGKQAAINAKTSTLDLAAAQREVDPTPIQQAMRAFEMYAPVLALATIAAQGFSAASTKAAFTAAAARVTTVAGTIATTAATAAQWLLNAALAANPVGLVILGITALIAVIVLAWKHSTTFRKIVTGAFNAVLGAARAAWSWVKGNWPLLLAIITGPIGLAVRFVVQRWDQITAATRAIPGRIRAAFANTGGLLRDAGWRIIQGLLDGIQSGFNRVRSKLGELTSMLPDWKGPASRDRKLLMSNGQLVMGGFLAGLESQYGAVQSSLGDFTGGLSAGASVGGTVSAAGSGAPAWARELLALLRRPTKLEIVSSGNRADDVLLELIRDRVRVKGGRASVLGVTG